MELEWGGVHKVARAVWALLAALMVAAFQPAAAQTPTPTPQQLEVFRNLSPEQQQAILDSIGGQDGAAGRRDQQLKTPQTTAPTIPGQAGTEPAAEPPGPPRMLAGGTLLLDVTVPEQTPPIDQAIRDLLDERMDRIKAGNPYRLDDQGRLTLPTFPPLNLNGLTELQASQRLNADPRLNGLHFAVTLLPIEPFGIEALKPFGYDVFSEVPTTFAPATDIPVPADYRIGPGDNVTVELFGKKSARYSLVVNRDGALNVPEFGPIQVTALTLDQMRQEVDQRVTRQMVGVRASVTMGELRSVRVFVVGDVKRPGAYTVSSLSTITNALFTSGGVSLIGSLRNIQLKRGGSTVTTLDLYDLLLHGDTSKDLQLRQGDAIFVPPVGRTAAISGQIRRPAIYEFRDGATAGELVALAGGLQPDADPRAVRLERIDPTQQRTVVNLDLLSASGRGQQLLAGDTLTVPKVFADTRGVTLEGQVLRPGDYAWREGMHLTELFGSLQMFKVNADQRYVLIRRETLPARRIEVLSADVVRAFERPATEDDPVLHSGDRVIVFGRDAERGPALADLLQALRMQNRDNDPLPIVSISGKVRAPGEYPLERNMTAADLIRAGGGLEDAAYGSTAELTRFEVVGDEARKTQILQLQLAGAAPGAALEQGTTALRPYDVLVIKETPEWRGQESITLVGEVRFPGTYPIRKGETLSALVARAGGLTEEAFPQGSVLTRQELKEQERQQIAALSKRLQTELTLLALQGAQTAGARPGSQDTASTLAAGHSLLAQLQSSVPTGRLVIDLDKGIRQHGSEDDIELRGGDLLAIPRLKQYVTVIGEVQNATTHVFKGGLTRDDYIELSGGTTPRADAKRIYVVRANGSVIAEEGKSWFGGAAAQLQPGDTVVVPLDAERMRPLPLWTAVTTIIYNLAVAVAAVNSF
jgi:protein involved in polysaccharide export with SLBB domain